MAITVGVEKYVGDNKTKVKLHNFLALPFSVKRTNAKYIEANSNTDKCTNVKAFT